MAIAGVERKNARGSAKPRLVLIDMNFATFAHADALAKAMRVSDGHNTARVSLSHRVSCARARKLSCAFLRFHTPDRKIRPGCNKSVGYRVHQQGTQLVLRRVRV